MFAVVYLQIFLTQAGLDVKLFVARCLRGIYKRTKVTFLKGAGDGDFRDLTSDEVSV